MRIVAIETSRPAIPDAHYEVIVPPSTQGPVCSAACVQLNASIRNIFLHAAQPASSHRATRYGLCAS
jgi:hypothetical protein